MKDNAELVTAGAGTVLPNDDGFYQITIKDKDIFLLVFSPKERGRPVDAAAIKEELNTYSIDKTNHFLISQVINQAAGVPVKIAELVEKKEELVTRQIKIQVTRDRMVAVLESQENQGDNPLTLEDVIGKLKEAGVSFGIDGVAVKKFLADPEMKVVCARGVAPIPGADACIKYYVDFANKGRPVELEDGTVDFKNTRMFFVATENQLLAEKIPATKSIPGMDVFGKKVIIKDGKDLILPVGKNVNIVKNNLMMAGLAGEVVWENNKLAILPVMEIKSDVDLSTGNIEFPGSIIIRGSVQEGFYVKAEGDIDIRGGICGAQVEGKNIKVGMGVFGMEHGYVKATETISAKFIEKANVFAGTDLYVMDVILHSLVNAGEKVIVAGQHGRIIGGTITAGVEIQAAIFGTRSEVGTVLEVGKKIQVCATPDDVKEHQNKIEDEMINNIKADGKIRVDDIAYAGVKIMIGRHLKSLADSVKHATFFVEEEDDKISIGPY
ncbi:hypothetical protein SAMN05660742_11777 [Propionispira arboris]|uniref:Flagellar Assembly Protein A N-terminal region domain-containing protein n=1 Tax=Propionispira arboris TaxID=84035 RepID=A0A1H7BQ80_9FIRM|nr:FapA family protein [Propionispira arboris]SEJ79863.1 hypothetical protein SAMN05660742_11777 [Propionispira arboris]